MWHSRPRLWPFYAWLSFGAVSSAVRSRAISAFPPRADPPRGRPSGLRFAPPLHGKKETPGEAPGVEACSALPKFAALWPQKDNSHVEGERMRAGKGG
jgi:hypothetical protein